MRWFEGDFGLGIASVPASTGISRNETQTGTGGVLGTRLLEAGGRRPEQRQACSRPDVRQGSVQRPMGAVPDCDADVAARMAR